MMLRTFLVIVHLMRGTLCEVLSGEHYLSRRVAGVFHYDRHRRYSLTFGEAGRACEKDFAATMADRRQMQVAYEAGLEECRAGWILGGEVAYPRVHLNWNCGQNQTGIISYGVRRDLTETWDVYCYKRENDCLTLMGDVPQMGLNVRVGDHFEEKSLTERGKTMKALDEMIQVRHTVRGAGTTTSASSVRDDLENRTYTSGPLNGLTRENEDPLNGDRSQEKQSHVNGQTPRISVSEILQPDPADMVSKSVSRGNKSVDLITWQEQKSTSQTTASTENASHDIHFSFVPDHLNVSLEITSVPLVSTPLLAVKSPETEDRVEPKQTGKDTIEYHTSSEEFSTLSSPVTTYQQTEPFQFTSALNPEPNTLMSDVKDPTVSNTHGQTGEGLAETLHPTSTAGLSDAASVHGVYEAEQLETELQDSKSFEEPASFERLENSETSASCTEAADSSVTINTLDVQQTHQVGLFSVPNTVASTQSYPEKDTTTQSKTLVQLQAAVKDLVDKTENVSDRAHAPLNQSDVNGNGTVNVESEAVILLLEESIQESTRVGPDLSTGHPTKLLQAQDLNTVTQGSEVFIPTAVVQTLDRGAESHASVPTSRVEVLQKEPNIKTTDISWTPTHFSEEFKTSSHHATPALILLNEPLKSTRAVLASQATTALRADPVGGRGRSPDVRTTVSCGGLLEGEEGEFQSPGFPQAYHSGMDCTWLISVPLGHLVLLTFQSLVIEEHRWCQYDRVTVFDGRTTATPELGRFCGSELPSQLRSSSHTMTVQMKSDSSVELDGFSARFQSVKSAGHVQLSLQGSWSPFGGRVEVDLGGIRGSICAEQWRHSEAAAVCRQLGFMGNAIATRVAESPGALPVSVSRVSCRGDESSLDECEVRRGEGCSVAERAAVHCQVAVSCSALRSSGVKESGRYIVDPDGVGRGQDPFPVFCDMDSQSGAGLTVVGHDSESRIRAGLCEEAGCYIKEIVYQHASVEQLRGLVRASLSCSQHVKLECRHVRFLGERWGWWTSWDGRRVDSWGGAATNSRRCACGERGDCNQAWLMCNCDANDEVWRTDEGFLSDPATLPVREVRFGDTRDAPMEMAFHTIGPLQCTGHTSATT